MPHKPTKPTSDTKPKRTLKTLKLTPRDSDDDAPPLKKPRTTFTLPPILDLTGDDITTESASQIQSGSQTARSVQTSLDVKEKGKQISTVDDGGGVLWVDKYEPTSEAELAVHKRKVEDVRRWLVEAFEGGPSGKLLKYRRILALTGPAGTAKTATLRVLSRELDFEILEWRNPMSERGPSALTDELPDDDLRLDTETLFEKFQAFLTRAMTCNSIFGHCDPTRTSRSRSLIPTHSQARPSTLPRKRQLVLLEDLPNLLHQPTNAKFQTTLRSLCIPTSSLSGAPRPPIVVILSDSGLRGEHPDDDTWDNGNKGRRWDKKEVLDIRNVLGTELLTSPYVTHIGFNPIAPTLMTKALQSLVALHFGSSKAHGKQPAREVIDIVVESANGDIRSAIMAIQFACVVDLPAPSTKPRGKVARKNAGETKTTTNVRAVLEAVTRREQSLVLFHLMGKILYNKRKFDLPASHLSARDAAKERESDKRLMDPPPLPAWLSHHERKASRVCIETLAAESPIDSSLLGMYTHQNYTQFCTDIDQCDGVCEGLSWVDCVPSSTSPYGFPVLTLSTLHSLPTPVPRKGQKVCKPTWFDVRTRELEASDAVGDVLGWLGKGAVDGDGVSMGKWTHADVAMELGGWLRAFDRCSGRAGSTDLVPPRTHCLFSHMPWSLGIAGGDVLGENEVWDTEEGREEDVRVPGGMRGEGEGEGKGWLEEDDIEEVD